MSAVCAWQVVATGRRVCRQASAYRAFYADCAVCPPPLCQGVDLCPEHTATARAGQAAEGAPIRVTSLPREAS